MSLISAEFVRDSQEKPELRKNYIRPLLIEWMNDNIKTALAQGNNWAPFPTGLKKDYFEFLAYELTVAGYNVNVHEQIAYFNY